jgi:transposase-like protein
MICPNCHSERIKEVFTIYKFSDEDKIATYKCQKCDYCFEEEKE